MTRPPPGERPLASELASMAGTTLRPCPHCGRTAWVKGDSSVQATRPDGGMIIKRHRICICGQHRRVTTEVEVPKGHKLLIVPADDEEEAAA